MRTVKSLEIGRAAMVGGMVCMCGVILANPPNVSNVTLAQPTGTRVAVVGYETDGPGIATFQFRTNGVDICHSEIVRTVTGDVSKYIPAAGTYSFTWDAKRDFPEQVVSNLTVEVTLWATNNPPLYCAVNLVLENGLYPVRFYGKESEVPFGVTNSWWKKKWLLMRQIPATEGEFTTLGSPVGEIGRDARENERNVRITKPFYMGVYEVTQLQWQQVRGYQPSYYNNMDVYEERPVESLTYNTIRGVGYDWPKDGKAVHPDGFLGLLRSRTGNMLEFDLPLEAQWEYACRAGTTGAWNNGTTIVNGNTDPNLNLLGRYQYNGGYATNSAGGFINPPQNCTDENATAKVGSYPPNAWGLYDMHGNVWEFCRDWGTSNANDPSLLGDDPPGPVSGFQRVIRGGCHATPAQNCRSARVITNLATPTSYAQNWLGFRVMAPAEVMIESEENEEN